MAANNPNIVTEDQLRAMSGYENRAALKRWLESNGVWYMTGKDGMLSTTVNQIDKASGTEAVEVEFV